MPKVSICIPQFNRCDRLRQVIRDLLNQTYQDYELLIVDDASTDQTQDVIAEFSDPRLQYFRNSQNLGLYPNFNRCLELADGDYIAIYHNHDRYQPDIVSRSVDILNEFPNVGYVHTGTISQIPRSTNFRSHVQDWQKVTDGKSFASHLIKRWDSPVHQPTVMARKHMYELVGGFDSEIYGACADSAIWLQMGALADVGYVALPLMQVTLRQEDDFYGGFHWRDVMGMARAHRLGLELLREFWGEARYTREKHLLQNRHDRHFFLLLLQWLARGDRALVQQGLNSIKQECSSQAVWISRQTVAIGAHSQPILAMLSKLYGRSMRFKGRLDNVRGERISRNYLRQESDRLLR